MPSGETEAWDRNCYPRGTNVAKNYLWDLMGPLLSCRLPGIPGVFCLIRAAGSAPLAWDAWQNGGCGSFLLGLVECGSDSGV